MKFIEYNFSLEDELKNKRVIGVDEAGVGDYFGPLCCAAIYIPKENYQKVLDLGVKDSKKLSDKNILKIYFQLKKLVKYSIHYLNPSGFNSLNKTYNGNMLKMFVHLNAITKLQNEINGSDYVFIDQYSTVDSIKKYYHNIIEINNWAKLPEVKGDIILAFRGESLNLSIAAASILARGEFVLKMQQMNKDYNVEFPYGSGEKVKIFARDFFLEHPGIENEICKKSFNMTLKNKDDETIPLFIDETNAKSKK